ncbi:MAG: M3 family metallopeptidase [Gammaproteobacteria bacterium WSBS_2016_MAG_OTU1]
MNNNAILDFEDMPRFAEITPQESSPAVDEVLTNLSRVADDVAVATPDWNSVWTPLAAAEESVSRVWGQIEHMHSVNSTKPWREAHQENLQKIAECYAGLGQHEGVYKNLLKLSQAADELSAVQQKIVQDALRDFQLSGVSLPADKQKEFRQNSEKLSALAAKFEENLLDATVADYLDIADEKLLGDMPADIKNDAAREEGGWRFTLMQPSYVAFMRYSPDKELRRTMYKNYNTRASEFGPAERNNSPIIDDILSLRAEQAKLLGFDSYADMALQTRMAESPERVADFLQNLAAKAIVAARKEIEEMKEFAASELAIDDLQPWDMMFVEEHFRHSRFDFTAAELRPYLQAERVLEGLFDCIQRLFNVQLKPADVTGWAEETRFFNIHNASGERIGGVYLDLFARPTKRGGAWMADALSRCRRGDKLQLPLAHVVCNFTPPPKDSPALLNWDEVLTLFHEFGHALHHLLTEVEEFAVSGISGVEWDAVELPSQFMENFIWDWRALEPMTAHVKSGEAMPRALFDKALAARQFQSGLRLVRQLEFAMFDMLLHVRPRPFMDVLNEVRRQTATLPMPEWGRFPCGFSHIFAGGYAAGYYSYLWAEALSADVFAMFAQSGDVMNAELGEKFRREVLAVGGSRQAMDSFTAMRGRKLDPDALLRHYGLL